MYREFYIENMRFKNLRAELTNSNLCVVFTMRHAYHAMTTRRATD